MSRQSFRQTMDIDNLRAMPVAAGTEIFHEGDESDGMYLVERGRVALWLARDGERLTLADVTDGNIFGEMSLLDGRPRTANATAVEDRLVVRVPKSTFELKMALSDPFVRDVFQLLVNNVRRVNATAEQARATARDQNPLTRLPGNRSIEAAVALALQQADQAISLVYFDFDNFKPFNDGFGFAAGDEAIALFAGALRQLADVRRCFVGHVGGDDFFASLRGDAIGTEQTIASLLTGFRIGVERFYDADTLRRGTYLAKDRDGNERAFPLLRASAIQLDLPAGRTGATADAIAQRLATGKKCSKASVTGLYRCSLDAE